MHASFTIIFLFDHNKSFEDTGLSYYGYLHGPQLSHQVYKKTHPSVSTIRSSFPAVISNRGLQGISRIEDTQQAISVFLD